MFMPWHVCLYVQAHHFANWGEHPQITLHRPTAAVTAPTTAAAVAGLCYCCDCSCCCCCCCCCEQVGAAEGVTAQLEEVAAQLAAYKAKLAAAQEEVCVVVVGGGRVGDTDILPSLGHL